MGRDLDQSAVRAAADAPAAQVLAMLDILIAQTVILRSENQGDFSGLSRREDIGSQFAWRTAVFAIESRSAGCSNDESTVSNRLA